MLSPMQRWRAIRKGRRTPEPEDPIRTCFQRDRDRIVHSKAFRRLMHKTQVFLSPLGDHYRTRLTHTHRGDAAFALHRARLQPQRGSRRSDRARSRSRPFALRTRGRSGAHRDHGRVRTRRALHPFAAKPAGRHVSGTPRRQGRTQPDATRCSTASPSTASTAERSPATRTCPTRSRGRSSATAIGLPTSTTTSMTRSAPASSRTTRSAAPGDRDVGPQRAAAHRDGRRTTSSCSAAVANEIKLSQPVLDAVEAIKEFMFERVYLNEAAKTEEPKAQTVMKKLFTLLHRARRRAAARVRAGSAGRRLARSSRMRLYRGLHGPLCDQEIQGALRRLAAGRNPARVGRLGAGALCRGRLVNRPEPRPMPTSTGSRSLRSKPRSTCSRTSANTSRCASAAASTSDCAPFTPRRPLRSLSTPKSRSGIATAATRAAT